MSTLYSWLAALVARGHLPEAFGYPFIIRGFLAILIVAPLLGGLSHLVVVRRMAFFSAAIGQAALTGLTLGILCGEPLSSAYAGIFGFCLLSALVMVYVKRSASLPQDTIIGVFMALTLGLGICLLVAATRTFNIHQIEAVMFGSLLTVTDVDLALLLVVGSGTALLLMWRYNSLLLDSLSPPLARVGGFDPTIAEYVFVVLLSMAIAVSLKIIGALLVEALVLVPAAAARNLARSTRGYLAGSIVIALVTCVSGLVVSTEWRVPTGGAIVLTLSIAFFTTLGISAVRSRLSSSAR